MTGNTQQLINRLYTEAMTVRDDELCSLLSDAANTLRKLDAQLNFCAPDYIPDLYEMQEENQPVFRGTLNQCVKACKNFKLEAIDVIEHFKNHRTPYRKSYGFNSVDLYKISEQTYSLSSSFS